MDELDADSTKAIKESAISNGTHDNSVTYTTKPSANGVHDNPADTVKATVNGTYDNPIMVNNQHQNMVGYIIAIMEMTICQK